MRQCYEKLEGYSWVCFKSFHRIKLNMMVATYQKPLMDLQSYKLCFKSWFVIHSFHSLCQTMSFDVRIDARLQGWAPCLLNKHDRDKTIEILNFPPLTSDLQTWTNYLIIPIHLKVISGNDLWGSSCGSVAMKIENGLKTKNLCVQKKDRRRRQRFFGILKNLWRPSKIEISSKIFEESKIFASI